MIENIDVHDLPEEQIKIIQDIADQIRNSVRKLKPTVAKSEDQIRRKILTPHKSDVIGRFSRRDIYDDDYFSHRIPGY
jgi:hypothetical protein